jgi:hypothetical protein
MNGINSYILRIADFFNTRLASPLVEVYKLGSLAHGGFSAVYSDIDVGLLLDCADICQTSTNFMLRNSPLHGQTCRLCAEVCERCAEDCERFRDDAAMQNCAQVCRRCAESCRRMASAMATA